MNATKITTRPIRVFTINHSWQEGERVRVELHRTEDGGYAWFGSDGAETACPVMPTVAAAVKVAIKTWGAAIWDMSASWIDR